MKAFERLLSHFCSWAAISTASPSIIERVIGDVTWPEKKAAQIGPALKLIAMRHPDYDLSFLATEPVPKALAWLEAIKGVGRKMSAATLNFSDLRKPALVLDTHVLRVFFRLGLISQRASRDAEPAYDMLMPHLENWTAEELDELHGLVKKLGQTACHEHRPACPVVRCIGFTSAASAARTSPWPRTDSRH